MNDALSIDLGEIMASRNGSVNPSRFPDEVFDLYSIPAFDRGEPDVAVGGDIGSTKQVIAPGDVLLSKIVPHIRRAWVVDKDRGRRILASSEWIVFRNDMVHPQYLRHILTGDVFHAQFMSTVAGVGGSLVRARPTGVARIKIPLPPLAEQQRIANILDKTDAIRRRRLKADSLSNALRAAAFHHIVGTAATSHADWPVVPIGETAEVQGGLALSARRRSYSRTAPYLRVANVYRDRFNLTEVKHLGVTDDEFRKTVLSIGDVLVVEGHGNRDEIGRSSVWDGSIVGCVHQNHLIRIRPNPKRLLSTYLSAFMNSPEGRSQLFRFGKTTSGLNTISISNVRDTTIRIPPIEVQIAFERFLKQHLIATKRQHRASSEMQSLFASLADRAFRGEL